MPRSMKTIFGIIMIIVYVGMGILILSGAFFFMTGWFKWIAGILLIVYGIWRAYRQFKGIDPDITTRE